MDWLPLNLMLMRQWENWLIIFLMLAISLIAVDIVVGGFSASKSTSQDMS